MSARDLYHETVKTALVKDGWTVTHDPYSIPFGTTSVKIDIGAERLIAAERGTEKIAVEVKSFVGKSTVADFKDALGAYALYAPLMGTTEPERRVFLAIPISLFEAEVDDAAFRYVFRHWQIGVLIFDPSDEVIVEWKI